jgi:hypothetical protein
MDITNYALDVELKEGIYYSKNTSKISYPETGNQDLFEIEEDSFWFKHRNKCIIEAFKKNSKNNLFFDIGGGNGYVSKGLQEAGIDCVLVEPGVSGCLNAQKRDLKNIVCSTLGDANFRESSISNIGVFDVVEHIEDDNLFLKMIHNYLLPEGLVFITVPAFQLLWSHDDVTAGHFRRYTIAGMEEKLKNNGFSIVYSTYFFSLLPIPIILFRKIPNLFTFKKNKAKPNEKYTNEHTMKDGIFAKISDYIFQKEISKIKKGVRISQGSSCLIIARKEKG